MQLWNLMMPSSVEYMKTSLFGSVIFLERVKTWYLGLENASDEALQALTVHNHTALLTDIVLKEKLKSYLDINQIPEEYRKGRSYYQNYESLLKKMYPVEEPVALKQDEKLAELYMKLHHPSISPLFADEVKLAGLPKAYMIVLEWDSLKDENLLYAERLRKANVEVHVAFYENAFVSIYFLYNEKIIYLMIYFYLILKI